MATKAAGAFLSSSPPFLMRPHPRNTLSSYSVTLFHEQASKTITSASAASVSSHFSTSVLLEKQFDGLEPFFPDAEDERSKLVVERKKMESGVSYLEENIEGSFEYPNSFEQQLLSWPLISMVLPSLTKDSTVDVEKLMDQQFDVVYPDNEAQAYRATLLVEGSELRESSVAHGNALGFKDASSVEAKIVPSTRLLERQSKKRRMSKAKATHEIDSYKKKHVERKPKQGYDQNDPLRMFLWGPETRKLLTLEEETYLISQLQDYHQLMELKRRLQIQFQREPTVAEWANAAGLSRTVLKSQLHSGNDCRIKLINANLRMVVHVAKQYLGRGLNFSDLLQEGSIGLMRSVQKFKPQSTCRFASYAYWWVRQAIRKAIFQHSRTIRLPETVYALQGKVSEAKKSYIQQERQYPSREELAQHAGMTVEKLQNLLHLTRTPLSLDQPTWIDQDTTLQEVTADSEIETPNMCVEKKVMRQHMLALLRALSPKERQVVKLRFGIGCDKQHSLSEIGAMFGLSKERVRQLESRALYKLKRSLRSQGLRAYENLLVK